MTWFPGDEVHSIANPGRLRPRRAGVSLVEVLVVLVVVAFFGMWVLMNLPRGRETARLAACQRNLAQLGVGLQLYHQTRLAYPAVPPLTDPAGPSPIRSLLDGLALPDLIGLVDPAQPIKPSTGPTPGAAVPGLVCPTDVMARGRVHPAPLSYRAITGATADGKGGVFEPSRTRTSTEVEAADGLGYTVAFVERLLGNGKAEPGLMNYQTVVGPIGNVGGASGQAPWNGDAGSNWAEANWRSALANAVLLPNGAPSVIAKDGQTAAMGASSNHPDRINVLYLDGSVRGVTPRVAVEVWRASTTVGTPPAPAP